MFYFIADQISFVSASVQNGYFIATLSKSVYDKRTGWACSADYESCFHIAIVTHP